LDTHARELRKHGVRIRLQEKSFQLLKALLEQPDEVVTREELQGCLWPGGTVVDFESGLNTAVKRLRLALSDSAEDPRYIETVARAGYRFIGPMDVAGDSGGPPFATPVPPPETVLDPLVKPMRFRRKTVAALVLLFCAAGLAFVVWPRPAGGDAHFTQITFERGQVSSARFAPDGHGILYSAQWAQNPRTVFLTNPVSPESRALGFPGANIASVSRRGELALLTQEGVAPITGNILSRVAMNGGAPVLVDRNVMSADWSPDGTTMAVVRAVDGVNQLEFPTGHVLYRTPGWMGSVRVSPGNDAIAFLEYPLRHDDAGRLAVVDIRGRHRALTEQWTSASGVAWHPSTGEIWFTASRESAARSLFAVAPNGRLRLISKLAGAATLRDIAPDGRVLISRDDRRLEMAAQLPGESTERDISWLDWSRAVDISRDGSTVLFDESGIASGGKYVSYLYRAADHNVLRLGEGLAMAFSPDETAALLLGADDRTRLRLVPIKGGAATEIGPCGLEYQWAKFFPDGKALLALANEPGQRLRLYRISLQGANTPNAISPPVAVRNVAISPDGAQIAALDSTGKLVVYAADRLAPPRTIPASDPLAPILWATPSSLYVQRQRTFDEIPALVFQLDPNTGERREWNEFMPRDPVGINAVTRILIARNQRSYVYSSRRVLSALLLVDGWR
jgi:DNA-binding winged helix-turn-helix (wHTH) protein/Tol biopolymer transport system component